MSNVRFCADLHFGHKAIALKRGFKDEFYHDEHIIEKWNSVVHKRDVTYILGDVTMETPKWYFRLDQLNGRKKVLLGNHDMMNHIPKLLKYVDKVGAMEKYSQKGSPKIFLTHCPIHPRELEYRVELNIHGHIHEHTVLLPDSTPDKRYICVSMEHIDYTPKLLNELI